MLKKIYCVFDSDICCCKSSSFRNFTEYIKKHDLELIMWQGASAEDLPQVLEGDGIVITDKRLSDRIVNELPVLGYQPENADYLPYKYIFEDFNTLDYEYIEVVYKRFHGIPLEILTTKRLMVREITVGDIDRLYEIYKEPSITCYMEGLYEDRAKEAEFVQSYIDNMYAFYNYGMWGVCDKETGMLIGRAGFSNREFCGRVFLELGYIIAKDYQRKGYATEVCTAIIKYAKEKLLADAVICLIHPDNIASKRLAIKLGFEYNNDVTVGGEPLELYVLF